MSIFFRCPECEHKLRAAAAVAGKRRRCVCGAFVTVPVASVRVRPRNRKSRRSAWRLKPKAGDGDLCEAITAWSPLCVERPVPATTRNSPASCRQGILVGSATALFAALVVVLYIAGRQDPAHQQTAQEPNIPPPAAQADEDPAAQEQDPLPSKSPDADPFPEPKKTPPQTVSVPPSKTAVKVEPRFDPHKIEIVEWYTTGKLAIIGDSGKEEFLELDEAGVQAGLVFVAVKVRLAGRMLEGKTFIVEKSDTALNTPGSNDPYLAIGCTFSDSLWFAPEKGQHPYAAPKDGYVTQGWLFYAPLKDLQTGRATFQLKDQRAVTLTLASRRP